MWKEGSGAEYWGTSTAVGGVGAVEVVALGTALE